MSGKSTLKMLAALFVIAPAPMFLSMFFKTTSRSFHNSEKVEIDIQRSGESLALVLKDACTGYNINDADIFTNKEFKPPVLAEQMDFEACTLTDRDPGEEVNEDRAFRIKALTRIFNGMVLLLPKFRRTIELQAASILQTGICSLPGEDGTIQYELDYQPKATHFPTLATAWTDPLADKMGDVLAQAKTNRKDGKKRSDVLLFGSNAWNLWVNDEKVQKILDNRRYEMGSFKPESRGEDATFMGYIWLEGYQFEMWTYDAYYEDPANNNELTDYLKPNSVVVMSSKARLEATFGAVGRFIPSDSRAVSFVPRVVRSGASRIGLFLNAWFSPNGETFSAGFKGRPLLIPTEIDSFSCMTVA